MWQNIDNIEYILDKIRRGLYISSEMHLEHFLTTFAEIVLHSLDT